MIQINLGTSVMDGQAKADKALHLVLKIWKVSLLGVGQNELTANGEPGASWEGFLILQ